MLFMMQMVGSVLLLMVMFGMRAPWAGPIAFAIKAVLLLLPLASVFGIYMAARTPPADQGRPLHVISILANGAYLMYGLYLWLLVLGNVFS